jgi:hypothetical protein
VIDGRLAAVCCLVMVSLAGCRFGGDATAAKAESAAGAATTSSTVPPPPSTTSVPPGPRSATGAIGGSADDRIGPPGGGKPVRLNIAEGQCFNEVVDPAVDPPVHTFQIIDCGQLHDAEVFAVLAMPEPSGAPYPGDQAMDRTVNRLCLARFAPYIGVEYPRSVLRLSVSHPVDTTWAAGDRTVMCSVYDGRFQPLAGLMRGTGR